MRKSTLLKSAVAGVVTTLSLLSVAKAQQLLLSRPAAAAAQDGSSTGRVVSLREARWEMHQDEELWTMTQVLKLTPQQHAAIRSIWEADNQASSPSQPSATCTAQPFIAAWPLVGQSSCITAVMTDRQVREFSVYVRIDHTVDEIMDNLTRRLGLTSQQRWNLRPVLVKSREQMYAWRSPVIASLSFDQFSIFQAEPSMDCFWSTPPSPCVGDRLRLAEYEKVRSVLTPPQKQALEASFVAARERKREILNTITYDPLP